jgi:hypothetical protein
MISQSYTVNCTCGYLNESLFLRYNRVVSYPNSWALAYQSSTRPKQIPEMKLVDFTVAFLFLPAEKLGSDQTKRQITMYASSNRAVQGKQKRFCPVWPFIEHR